MESQSLFVVHKIEPFRGHSCESQADIMGSRKSSRKMKKKKEKKACGVGDVGESDGEMERWKDEESLSLYSAAFVLRGSDGR